MMDTNAAIDLCRAALLTAVIVAAPMLVIGMVAGLVVGLLQALTQVQDQTVSFVPKIMAMAGVLIACAPWLLTRLVDFTREVFENAGGP